MLEYLKYTFKDTSYDAVSCSSSGNIHKINSKSLTSEIIGTIDCPKNSISTVKINWQRYKIAFGLDSRPNIELHDLRMLGKSQKPYFVHTGHTVENIGSPSIISGFAWVSEMEDEILASSTTSSSLHVWSTSL
ncbi:MAG: hypothetical protein MHPSP_003309 [Paramarteilia canceri]